IEVCFDIDANGILHVTAKEKSTGKEASITIQNTTTLSEEEIKRMIEEAQRHAEEDRRRREHAELKNTLDSTRVQAERILQEKQ
ncbi:Hsp70 family protein, partial [Acinetobacter baumannii]